MTVVAAFLLPGLPHPLAKPDVAPWGRLAAAAGAAGRALAAARPDTVVVYSTQWIAVLDQLWQTRAEMQGLHVDENWYEWQDIPYHIRTDVGFSEDCIQSTGAIGVRSRPVDYDGFPVDTGTLVAQHFLNPDAALPIVATSNNLYHDWDRTQQLGGVVRSVAARRGQRVAVVAVGGLSARMFRAPIDPATDHIATNEDDAANRALLATLEQGDSAALRQSAAAMAGAGPTDMGLKHLAFLVGATGAAFNGAVVHGYEPIYGTGAAVVELRL